MKDVLNKEEVQESISFMKAIKAFEEGKTIRCKFNKDCFRYESPCCESSYNEIRDSSNGTPCIGEILYGKWYIEEK